MKNRTVTILLIAAMLIGLSLLLYPSFSNWWNTFHQSRAIDSYSQTVKRLDEVGCQEIFAQARAYNEGISRRENTFLLTPAQKTQYESLLNTEGNGIMGYVEIPAISLKLPIYHGTGEGVLQVAVGHLEWSSLPVGGEGSHCVLSGHRGLPSARLFTDLDMLETGDAFSLHILDRVLTYRIDQILTVEPQQTEELMVFPGEDLCTLMTCTPYGINSHRLLVRGVRQEQEESRPVAVSVVSDAVRLKPEVTAPVMAAPVILVLLTIWMLPKKSLRR